MKPAQCTFIISGGCSGLGLATALDLHGAGAHILLLDLSAETGLCLVKELGHRAKFIKTDVTETPSIEAAINGCVEWVNQTGKPLAGIVAAAGVAAPTKVRETKRFK